MLEGFLDRHAGAGDVLVASSVAWIEVSRALGHLPALRSTEEVASIALSGVAEHRVTDEVVALARRIGPPMLRTLDALHLATAMLLDVERLLAYDERLIDACLANGLVAVSPGRGDL